MSIVVENLTHIYSKNSPFERVAIKDVSFSVEDGEFVGLIGHTGSGKSTLIEHLNGLLKPDSGHIYINGKDITAAGCNLAQIRSMVGLVFQYPEYQLFEETVFKDIAYGPSNLGLSKDEIRRRVFEAAEFVGLSPEVMDKSPFDLSGGQKRRVAIAGILAMEPQILILDEPTAGLDPAGRNDLIARLKLLHKEKKLTIIVVTHSMEDISDMAQRILVMSDGALVCNGTCREVFSQGKYLESIGLDVPQICTVMDFLRSNCHIEIPDGIYDVNKAADIIFDAIKGAKNA